MWDENVIKYLFTIFLDIMFAIFLYTMVNKSSVHSYVILIWRVYVDFRFSTNILYFKWILYSTYISQELQ